MVGWFRINGLSLTQSLMVVNAIRVDIGEFISYAKRCVYHITAEIISIDVKDVWFDTCVYCKNLVGGYTNTEACLIYNKNYGIETCYQLVVITKDYSGTQQLLLTGKQVEFLMGCTASDLKQMTYQAQSTVSLVNCSDPLSNSCCVLIKRKRLYTYKEGQFCNLSPYSNQAPKQRGGKRIQALFRRIAEKLFPDTSKSRLPLMAASPENEAPKPKHRPIIRIGIFIIAQSFSVSIVCCTAGVLALLLLPVLAKKTYVSENALMPGSASPMLSDQDVSGANRFVNELTSLKLKSPNTGIEIPRLIALHMLNLGGEVSYHKFQPQQNKFHPLHFFTSSGADTNLVNSTCSSYALNAVGIIRAPRGDGKEAIVLVTPYNPVNLSQSEALSLGIAYSIFSLLTQVSWLAKDIIWIAADSRHGQYASVSAWLRDYHTPSFGGVGKLNAEMCHRSIGVHELQTEISETFQRAGTMAAALVIEVAETRENEKDTLAIYAEASNGQMPNLDLINVVNYLAVHGQGLHVKVEKLMALLDSKWLKFLGEIFESVGKTAKSLNPQWMFGIPVEDYVDGSATLVKSLYNQALGVPTGSHGAFRDFQVDAITLVISPRLSSTNKARQIEVLFWGGRLIEGIIRSVNNLLEKFHQSFFLYLLTSSNKFVSVGVYMIAFLLLVAPLPVVAASLFSDAIKWNSSLEKGMSTSARAFLNESAINRKSWRWLYPTKTVFLIHLWGAIVSLLPYFIYLIPNCQPTSCLLIWALLSLFALAVLHLVLGSTSTHVKATQPQGTEWVLLKSVTISSAFIGLCIMSIINFATAEIGALLLVPLCLMIRPLKVEGKDRTLKAISLASCNLLLVIVGFPGVAFFVLKGAFGGLNGSSSDEFWYWVESLWAWNSATYIYICMVHLPCWVLCIYILLHP